MWWTPRSLTLRWDAHCGVWLHSMMHTAESGSAAKLLEEIWLYYRTLMQNLWCTPRSFLKIPISRRNQNRIWTYFSLFIRGPEVEFLNSEELSLIKFFPTTCPAARAGEELTPLDSSAPWMVHKSRLRPAGWSTMQKAQNRAGVFERFMGEKNRGRLKSTPVFLHAHKMWHFWTHKDGGDWRSSQLWWRHKNLSSEIWGIS